MNPDWLLVLCLGLGAALYTSVGHAGASAYLAAMALFGVPTATMRPTALVLNVIAASFAALRYARADLFRWRTLWPFLIGAAPFAFLGGSLQLPSDAYRKLVGLVLLLSAARLLWPRELTTNRAPHDPPIALGIVIGAGIGLLAGITGTGGGIFLSPLLLFLGWSETRAASGAVVVFILCNSLAGLAGNVAALGFLPRELPVYAGAVLLGATLGTTAGIRLPTRLILKALGLVLIVAGVKLIAT
jgi:uncharacterized protein